MSVLTVMQIFMSVIIKVHPAVLRLFKCKLNLFFSLLQGHDQTTLSCHKKWIVHATRFPS